MVTAMIRKRKRGNKKRLQPRRFPARYTFIYNRDFRNNLERQLSVYGINGGRLLIIRSRDNYSWSQAGNMMPTAVHNEVKK